MSVRRQKRAGSCEERKRRGRRGSVVGVSNRIRGDSGLLVLEWLLIFAAIGALGASSVMVVRSVLATTTDVADDPAVLLIEADVAATQIAADFATAAGSSTLAIATATATQQCSDLASRFSDVVDTATWVAEGAGIPDDPATPEDESTTIPAHCDVVPRT